MGVTGSGKTTIGEPLAHDFGWEFADADDFHSPAYVEKMRRGIPLDNADRAPWLASLRAKIERWIAQKRNAVLACSALKRAYRGQLEVSSEVRFVYLKGSYDLIRQRLHQRHGHFADEQLLASQFAALEEPKNAVGVDIGGSADEIVAEIKRRLGLGGSR
jgi:gluconokinase